MALTPLRSWLGRKSFTSSDCRMRFHESRLIKFWHHRQLGVRNAFRWMEGVGVFIRLPCGCNICCWRDCRCNHILKNKPHDGAFLIAARCHLQVVALEVAIPQSHLLALAPCRIQCESLVASNNAHQGQGPSG